MVNLGPPTIRKEPLSEQSRAAFASTTSPDWCLQLIQDPNVTPLATPNRTPKTTTEDSFIAETLATNDTITAWQTFYRFPSASGASTAKSNGSTGCSPGTGEIVALVAMESGMNGHDKIAHGGLVATILDEVTGTVAGLHKPTDRSAFTAALNVTFKKPLTTPAIVLCRSWLEERSKGRKAWLKGTIEDGKGGVYAEAEALYIEVESDVPKL